MFAKPLLQVYARVPALGKVKTRLQPDLSPGQSLAIYHLLLERTLNMVAGLRDYQVELWLAGTDADPGVPDLIRDTGLPVHWQQGGDLGERLTHSFSQGLARAPAVVCIGVDCPDLDADYLAAAYAALAEPGDLVLGPADDGGYVLIGMRRLDGALFRQLEWGSEHVLQQTLIRAKSVGYRLHQLAVLRDIDRPADWYWLQSRGWSPGLA